VTSSGERVRWLRWLDRLPIRWRLAVATAGLTGLILLLFALVSGIYTIQRVRGDFSTQTAARFDAIRDQLRVGFEQGSDGILRYRVYTNLRDLRGERGTVVAVWGRVSGRLERLASSNPRIDLGPPRRQDRAVASFRVETRQINQAITDADGRPLQSLVGITSSIPLVIQVGRSYDTVASTERRVETALTFGVIGGTLLALLAGLAVGQRAMRPVRRMTGAARHIARTRDLEARMPVPVVRDEISELAVTLQDMLDELAASQARIDESLQRQREFVADASHELRTPLTAVQANLELLALSTEGEDREAAESALRSARRMRRLVADLLLLARMDARREAARDAVDLDRAILEAVDELEPQLGGHEVELDLEPVTLDGVRDELVRLVANLLSNALRHTPDGTEIRIVLRRAGTRARLIVEDDGPGIPDELRERIFERFVRRGGEGAGSTGIGLAIVRAAAQRHGGDVHVEPTHEDGRGARFVVTLAVRGDAPDPDEPEEQSAAGDAAEEGGDGRLLRTPRRAAEGIRRRLRSSGVTRRGARDPEERLGGAAPDDGPPASDAGEPPASEDGGGPARELDGPDGGGDDATASDAPPNAGDDPPASPPDGRPPAPGA
jgi:signal transduction histidine kinase